MYIKKKHIVGKLYLIVLLYPEREIDTFVIIVILIFFNLILLIFLNTYPMFNYDKSIAIIDLKYWFKKATYTTLSCYVIMIDKINYTRIFFR